jgi:exonuclease SbcC
MKIRLQNFRCYTDATFDFGDGGLALLSGPSGQGKSTILMGIFFALFGEGTKVQTYGKTSCRVELEFDGMKIVRTKRPNRLVLNDVYEDASAQEIINRKFGDTFKTSGYIQQNNIDSFIMMSPIEKLTFLEKFAFRDVNLGKIKGRCKAHISKRNEELVGAVSQLSMARNILDEMEQPNEVKFPLKCKKGQREKVIKNENIRFKNCNTLIRRSEKRVKEFTNEINDLRILEATLQSRKETFEELEEKLEDLGVEIDDQIYEGDEELANYEKRLEVSLARRKLHVMEDQLEDDLDKLEKMRRVEETGLEEEKKNIDDVLWKEYSKAELATTISELKGCLSDLDRVETLRKEMKRCKVDPEKHHNHKQELTQYTEELEDKQRLRDRFLARQELYSCPSCATKLRLLNESLYLADDVDDEDIEADLNTIQEDIQNLKYNISKLQRVIPDEENKLDRIKEIEIEIQEILSSYEETPDANGVREDLEYLRDYQANQTELEKKLKELDQSINQEKFSSSYSTFKRGVEKLEEEVEKLRQKSGDADEKMNEEELRERIVEQRQTRDKLRELEKRRDKMIENRDKCKRILDQTKSKHMNTYGGIQDEDELEEKKRLEEKKITDQENKRKRHEQNLQLITSWEKYQEDLENYQVWETKVEELEKREKEARNEYAAATMLKDKILEAESIAMVNIVDSINAHARVYLDSFFQDHPISVQLQPFKQTKKATKPQISIVIEYKGMEADLKMLSGGELSRVILAYTLALAEMFNTPLVLLDECTASLDQDLTSDVFDAIRENFNGKMTLFIAHQVITGTFDKVVRLGKDSRPECNVK